MKPTLIALMLGSAIAVPTGAASAQDSRGSYGSQQQQQPREGQPAKASSATITIGGRTVKVSAQFVKAYQELQTAVTANDGANIAGKLAAAQGVSKSPEERYLVAQLQLKAATAAKNEAAMGAALQALIASGGVPQQQLPLVYVNLGKVHWNQKQFDQAAAMFQKALQADPNNTEATSLLAQARQLQGRTGDAMADLTKAIAQRKASGSKPPEELYKRAVSLAYEKKQPNAIELSREWVSAYPSPASWSDALRIYRNLSNLDEAATLDVLRLARATGALKGDGDFHRYAFATITRGYPGEAKAVLEEGFAANAIDRNKALFKQAIGEATTKSAGERARLSQVAQTALAAKTAKQALTAGDVLYGYGEFARAAELYRAALGRPGADASLINLHLGMALARSGDKAGATAALNAVTGARAELAKYWLIYLATRS